jgi:hypothetical protein
VETDVEILADSEQRDHPIKANSSLRLRALGASALIITLEKIQHRDVENTETQSFGQLLLCSLLINFLALFLRQRWSCKVR